MFNRYFSQVYAFFQHWKWPVIALVVVSTVIAGINLRSISFENNIEVMLPENKEIQRNLQFLRESHFSDNIVVSLSLKSPERSVNELIGAVDQLADSLESPYVTEVISSISTGDAMEQILSFYKYAPQLLDKEALSQIEDQIDPESVKNRLSQLYLQLLSPASAFMKPFICQDPLGTFSGYSRKIEKLSSSLGYNVLIEKGHFISRDRRHALLIVKTPIKLTDGFGSRKLISYLETQLNGLPSYVSADIIAGHLHTISNEDVIKRDIRLMLIMNLL